MSKWRIYPLNGLFSVETYFSPYIGMIEGYDSFI